MLYIGWNIEFIFFAHSEKQCLQQSKNLQRFCLRSLLLPFQEENNPKIMFNAINVVYNSIQKIYSRKKNPSIIKSKLSYHCARSIQNQILNCIQKTFWIVVYYGCVFFFNCIVFIIKNGEVLKCIIAKEEVWIKWISGRISGLISSGILFIAEPLPFYTQ